MTLRRSLANADGRPAPDEHVAGMHGRGQTLCGIREIMFVERRWDETYRIDWNLVKECWTRHWDIRRPILVEKSPANIIRAREIESAFSPAYFLILWRNPYAHCESLIRRNRNSPGQAASFAIRCLRIQNENRKYCLSLRLPRESIDRFHARSVSYRIALSLK